MNNRDRQENEILVLSSIYNHNEFSYIQGDIIEIYFNVFPTNNDKVYHGSAPCAIMPSEFIKIIEDYEKGNTCQKQLLQKKYGKKQIQEIEKHLTKNYLKENTKTCPQCQTTTAKVDGCNKMTCTYCNAQFCWLCGTQITTENPYDHFLLITNMCYTRLFD
nr:PREDICTED: E3 ubiquitin-protein ligase RNF14-like isoform X2 [Megachile rotundata]